MNICIKCKHSKNHGFDNYICYHPVLVKTNVVSGTVFGESCFYERNDQYSKCGKQGLLYDEKQTVKQQFFKLFGK